ncbi:hypothetical protein VOI54_12405 [Tamlana sp. 2201CG12-4]|uniref:hypothetical protein n=1 Tax=Tamlana sp. 2201CG12-4 TaxID=3112582 RepID=UPI002DB63073|nr:hypothetical protein [Tamlana sp. 2201CG12-4]MEC3907823.1 hypothetical protein [Tamlana sp. 2201CG12-4]
MKLLISHTIKVKHFIFLLLPISVFTQNITGKVYDNETTVKGIDVFNISKKTRTHTDDNGNFTIEASINDTLSFHSTFHNPKIIRLTKQDFDAIMIVELRKTVNRLKEILIQNDIQPKDFDDAKEEQKIIETIAEDSKVNPHLYQTSSQYGLDIVRLIGLLGKALKSKKIKDKPVELTKAKTLDSLFQHNAFFNDDLLNNNLSIPVAYKQLFYEYCESQGIDKKLLNKEHQIILLERLVVLSQTYLEYIENSEKP